MRKKRSNPSGVNNKTVDAKDIVIETLILVLKYLQLHIQHRQHTSHEEETKQ
jgi:hypothetical protein